MIKKNGNVILNNETYKTVSIQGIAMRFISPSP